MQKVILIVLIAIAVLGLGAGFVPSASASIFSPFDGPGYGMGVNDTALLAELYPGLPYVRYR